MHIEPFLNQKTYAVNMVKKRRFVKQAFAFRPVRANPAALADFNGRTAMEYACQPRRVIVSYCVARLAPLLC